MPTVIDALVLEVGLDPSKLTEQQRAAIQALRDFENEAVRSGNEVESQGKKLNEFFTNLKREALGLIGLFVGGRGLKDFVVHVTNTDAALGRMEKTIGMSARELSGWQGAVERIGGKGESAVQTLDAMNAAMQRMAVTGQIPAELAAVFNAIGGPIDQRTGQFKKASEALLEFSTYLDRTFGNDTVRKAAFLREMVPGINQDTINLLILGREQVEKLLAASEKASGVTGKGTDAARKFQSSLAGLEQQTIGAWRALQQYFYPALTATSDGLQKLISQSPAAAAAIGTITAALGGIFALPGMKWLFGGGAANAIGRGAGGLARLGSGFLGRWLLGPLGILLSSTEEAGAGEDEVTKKIYADLAASGGKGKGSAADHEAYIRAAAKRRGIDPDIAVQVARSEGLGGRYAGDDNSSFGDFQLHYGGRSNRPGMRGRGLGDEFTAATGLDATNPDTWRAQIDFALDQALKKGWGPWHGWRGLPRAGLPRTLGALPATFNSRGGDVSHSSSVHVGQVIVNTKATDGAGIARDIGRALENQRLASAGNYALNG